MLVEVAIETKRPEDKRRLLELLAEVAPESARFGVKTDAESGLTILLGDSEEELGALIGRAKKAGEVEFSVGAPEVAYRETIVKEISVTHTHKKFMSALSQFAQVTLTFEPLADGSGFVFQSGIADGSLLEEYIAAVEKGLNAERQNGLLAGIPVTDFKATLIGGKYHEVDSNPLSFNIAARAAFRELGRKGAVKLLEPIMKVEVVTPDDFLGGVIGDLNSRRGQVQGTDSRGNAQVVTAMVPLANMFGYINTLRSMSQGRASFTMKFSRYDPVPVPEDDDPGFRPAMAMRA